MKGIRIFGLWIAFMVVLLAGETQAQFVAPPLIEHQGRLTSQTPGGQEVPITGTTQLKLSIFQGGTNVAGSGDLVFEETATVDPNNLGFFTHHLGSGTVTVGPLSAALFFTNDPVFLDIQILTGPKSGQVTRERFVTVPYAFQAQELGGLPREGFIEGVIAGSGLAGGGSGGDVTLSLATGGVNTVNIVDGSVTSTKIADLTIQTQDLADGSVTSAKIADGAVGTADLADGAVTSAKIADGTIASADLADAAVTTAKLADNSVTSTKIVDGSIGSADVNSAQIQLRVSPSGCAAGTAIRVINETGTVTCESTGGISGSGTTNFVSKFTGATTLGNSAIFESGGNVGIGTASPTNKLTVADGAANIALAVSAGGPAQLIVNPTGTATAVLRANRPESTTAAALFQLFSAGVPQWHIGTFGGNENLRFTRESGGLFDRMVIDTAGNVGIGTTNPAANARLHIDGGSLTGVELRLESSVANGNPGIYVKANTPAGQAQVTVDRADTGAAATYLFSSAGSNKWQIALPATDTTDRLGIFSAGGS